MRRYVACPQDACKGKKVQPADGDQFFCEKCNEMTTAPHYRYLLSLVLQDETGSVWLSCFDREGEKILGVPAREMQKMREEDPQRYQQVFAQATNKDWVFGVKVRKRASDATRQRNGTRAERDARQQVTADSRACVGLVLLVHGSGRDAK